MSPGPMDTFSDLLRGCINDSVKSRRTRQLLEGAGLLLLGVVCSLATAYVLGALGFVV